ncbi:MAG: thioredoxin-disulfide reductase [Myxococcales bacterium]|nr:thioredoxin-disulfide reductase [Myxococcales bacterium]
MQPADWRAMHKVVILGSGPAGLTAAIYTGRALLEPVVFEGGFHDTGELMTPGGQLMITTEVENFPGFPEGVTGPELVERCRKQAQRFGAVHRDEVIEEVDFSGFPLRLRASDGWVEAATVIVATGANARWLGCKGETEYQNRGVSACATCDGAFFKDMEVVVVGGGDTAMEEANFLTRYCPRVTIVHRRDSFRASKTMAQRSLQNPRISVQWNAVVDEVVGDGRRVTGVRLRSTADDSVRDFACQGVFAAIGHEPNTKVFRGHLDLHDDGYVRVGPRLTTNVAGVFAAGDVCDKRYRQAITAAGMGCMAALEAEKHLDELVAAGRIGH